MPATVMCKDCRYWSDKLSTSWGARTIESMCLSKKAPFSQQYTKSFETCRASESGKPIDADRAGREFA